MQGCSLGIQVVAVVYGASLACFTVCLLREYPVGEV